MLRYPDFPDSSTRTEKFLRCALALRTRQNLASLPNTKAGKNHPQQIVRRELPRDRIERMLGQAQLFGQQVQRGAVHMQLGVGDVQVLFDLLQCLHMAGAGDVGAFGGGLLAGDGQQLLAQGVEAVTGFGR